jgi:hypothetical protein
MKAKVNVEELEKKIDFESVSNRLIQLSENGGLNRRKTITDLLDKVKPALEQARERKVSFAALTQFLKESGIPVSEPTLRQYLKGAVTAKPKKKAKRAVAPKATPKSTPEVKAEVSHKAPPRLAR